MRPFYLLPFTLFLFSFSFFGKEDKRIISGRSEYLDSSYLACTQVGTPDPYHGCFKGQQIVMTWYLPYRYPFRELTLHLDVLYGDGTMDHLCYPVNSPRGRKAYRIIMGKYEDKEGIDTYRTYLMRGEKCIGLYEHQLWKELIEVCDECP